MNNINLVGRMTRDAELKYVGNDGKAIANFTIAVNRKFAKDGQQKADFINCVCFGKQAENLCNYQGKGSLIGVNGSLNIDQYKDQEGNNKSFTKVVVNEIEYLSSKGEANTSNNDSFQEIESDDIPF